MNDLTLLPHRLNAAGQCRAVDLVRQASPDREPASP